MRRILTAIVLTLVWVQLAAAQTIREIAQLPLASSISASDSIACQQGGVGTAYTRCTPGAILSAGLPGALSTLTLSSTSISAFAIQGGGTVGPNDYRQVEFLPIDTNGSATGSPQTLFVRRVGNTMEDSTGGNKWVTSSQWVMSNTTAWNTSYLRTVKYNTKIATTSGAGVMPGETWNLFSVFTTQAAEDPSAIAYNNVSLYAQAVRAATPASGVGTRLMGGVIEYRDLSGASSATSGIARTLELDMMVNGADDYGGSGIGREVMLFVLGKGTIGSSPTITSLMGVYPVVGDGVTLLRGITFANQLSFTQSLWDTRDSVQGASANAIWLRAGHRIALDGDSVAAATASTNYIYSSSGSLKIHSPTVILADGEAGPITVTSDTIAAATGENMTIKTGGLTKTFGVQYPGYGQVLTATNNANGNSLFGASPNDLSVPNRLTIGLIRTSGPTYTLSGSVTPTSFSGTGTTATVGFAAITSRVIPVGSEVTISGASPSGYNGTWTVTVSDTVSVQFASTATGSLVTAGTMTYKMAAPTLMQMTANWAGEAAPSPQFAPFKFTSATDTSQTKGTNAGAPIVRIDHNFGGAATGGKHGLQVIVTQTSATNDPPDGVHPNQQHTAIDAHLAAAYNAGGTGTGTNAAGSLYGLNPQVKLQAGATDWRLANGLGEVNMSVAASTVPVTIAGTPGTGDTVTLQFASADISGSPVSVVWTVGASQTATMIANNLEALVNADAALQAAHISAVARSGVVDLYWPRGIATLTITASKTGTVTATKGTTVEGATVDVKLGASIIRLSDDTDTGRLNSAYLLFGSQPDASRTGRMAYGLVFGGLDGYDGMWSWGKESTLIGVGVQANVGGAGKSGVLAPNWTNYGLDLSRVAFNSASLKVPGFEVTSGSGGVIKVGGYQLAATSSGLTIDTNTGKIASSVAITAGGGGGAGTATNNYFIGDVGFDLYGGSYLVTAVNTSTGAVSSMTVLTYPAYQGSAPSTPYAVTGGSGAGWTVTPTYSGSFAPLSLQPTGGDTEVGGYLWTKGYFTAGDGTGQAEIQLYGAPSSPKTIALYEENSGYVLRSVLGLDASDNLILEQYDASGVSQGYALLFDASTGQPRFGRSGAWAANGSVATTMTSLGPTGSHTTVQEWLAVKNASGVVRYIPAY